MEYYCALGAKQTAAKRMEGETQRVRIGTRMVLI